MLQSRFIELFEFSGPSSEQQSLQKSFQMPFSNESFYYLSSKLVRSPDIVMYSIERKQHMALDFDDLSIKNFEGQSSECYSIL
jgi:hypothetical protein